MKRSFFERRTEAVAEALVGAVLVHGQARGVIVETEAYLVDDDPACHACGRRTKRTEIFWGPCGRAYVYLCYGLHWCLNVVAHEGGSGGVVLLRAAMPEAGVELMRRRRKRKDAVEKLASGPARLTQAFGVTGRLNGADMVEGEFRIEKGRRPPAIARGPRIGITKAMELPLRFWWTGNEAVSRGAGE